MKTPRFLAVLAVMALIFACSTPLFGANKDMIQLQTEVQQLQDQMARMQQAFDERMGIMRNLIEQNTDNMNRITTAIGDLQKILQQQQSADSGHSDQISGQIQALNDSLDELKGRVARISKQLDDMAAQQQNINQPQPPASNGAPGPGAAQSQAPPAEVLYSNALRDYNAGKLDLAAQEFGDYMKYYPATDLAGNAQFYLADIQYQQKNFAAAVKSFDKVLEQYPGGNKTQAAQLRKGLALLQLGQKDAGVRELNSLIQRYPRSIEADTARAQLRKLGVTPAATSRTARKP
jgi:tol-pal system protein YbgF